jgi:hypothetical protein
VTVEQCAAKQLARAIKAIMANVRPEDGGGTAHGFLSLIIYFIVLLSLQNELV